MRSLALNLLLTVVLGGLVLAAVLGFNHAAAPQDRVLPTEGAAPPDPRGILDGVTSNSVLRDMEQLCRAESRFSGSEGCRDAAQYLESELTGLGYRVTSQPFRAAVPVTKQAEILDESGRALPGLNISPLLPNWFRTATTPPGGVLGRVYVGERGLAREFEGVDLEGNIAMLPVGVSWQTVAAMNVGAVLYYDDGRQGVGAEWEHSVEASLAVPRFLVEGDALSLSGRTVLVRARVDFENRPLRNIMAVLEAPGAGELIVLQAHYDGYSYAPDRAPAAGHACSPAAMLAAARHLAETPSALKRSVMVLATAGHAQGLFGVREFVQSLGARDIPGQALDNARSAVEDLAGKRERLENAIKIAADETYWSITDPGEEDAYWDRVPRSVREAFVELYSAALDAQLMAALEALTAARVDWVRAGMPVESDSGEQATSFKTFSAAREARQRVETMLATPPGRAKKQWPDVLAQDGVPARVVEEGHYRLERLRVREQEVAARLATAEYLAGFERVLFLGIDITPGGAGRLALATGKKDLNGNCMPADSEIMKQLADGARDLDAAAGQVSFLKDARRKHRLRNMLRDGGERPTFVPWQYGEFMYLGSTAVLLAGHTAFSLVTPDDAREGLGTPFDTLDRLLDPSRLGEDQPRPMENLVLTSRLLAGLAGRLARGHGRVVPVTSRSALYDIKGRVVSRVGENLTPDHAMPGTLVRVGPKPKVRGTLVVAPPGMGIDLCVIADEEGTFAFPGLWEGSVGSAWGNPVDLDAARLRPEDGAVTWTLLEQDSGPNQPFSVRNVPMKQLHKIEAMPVLFRSKAVQVVPMSDPATLAPYAAFGFIETDRLAAPEKSKTETSGGSYVCYVEPDTSLYFTFKKGSFYNPNLTEVRAFALGAEGPADGTGLEDQPELAGDGYLAADHDSVANIEFDVALSMAQVNARRVAMQQEHGIADELVVDYSRKSGDLAEKAIALRDDGRVVEGKRVASDSVAYSANIHPVIRKQASDAIVGILFYLLLAVPFAVFMEKLLVGHPDIRRQIAVQGLIFILFFAALRFLHPAYQLVRSSYMILLGFLTFALAALVSVFVSGRFAGSIAELQQKIHERVEVADVSRAGAAASAFVLGLGHMRKRKVRTGLTVGTLVLTTFVMLCFTSVTTDVVDVEFAVGKAPYTGLFIRDRSLRDVSPTLQPLREIYGRDHVVALRKWSGSFSVAAGKSAKRSEFSVSRTVGEREYDAVAHAFLGLTPAELRITQVRDAFDVFVRWFESERELSCFLPREMADALALVDEDVETGNAKVILNGKEYRVLGIFDGHRMESVLDLDGESLLPVDVLGLIGPGGRVETADDSAATEAPEDMPRLPGRSVVIMATEAMSGLIASVAVSLEGMEYAEAREIITSHLERSALPAYYGLDGVAYYGGKFRQQSVGGLLEIILPIIIAAITVLNTMRGSVYERKDEIYVFNSVGLSPTHIKALFLAEASVYAVVGAVGGYLLAQGIGAGVQAFGLAGGLTMNYSSLASVFVSVVIMGVVLVSSLFPARMAARLAAPAEMMTRQRHTAAGDLIEIDLPFVFNRRDRVAVIPYFVDWFHNYGEGSAGEFYCNDPLCGVVGGDGGAAPCVETTTWLRPYDLGVSQSVRIVVRHNPETGDNLAVVQMQRLSGDVDSWERCCHAFIGLLRKRFLTWRAVADGDRERLLDRGRILLEAGHV